jgi:hypothetical protein
MVPARVGGVAAPEVVADELTLLAWAPGMILSFGAADGTGRGGGPPVLSGRDGFGGSLTDGSGGGASTTGVGGR